MFPTFLLLYFPIFRLTTEWEEIYLIKIEIFESFIENDCIQLLVNKYLCLM